MFIFVSLKEFSLFFVSLYKKLSEPTWEIFSVLYNLCEVFVFFFLRNYSSVIVFKDKVFDFFYWAGNILDINDYIRKTEKQKKKRNGLIEMKTSINKRRLQVVYGNFILKRNLILRVKTAFLE